MSLEDKLKNEDIYPKNEDKLTNEDDFKNEDDLIYENDLTNEESFHPHQANMPTRESLLYRPCFCILNLKNIPRDS